jgi:hypothetical protein
MRLTRLIHIINCMLYIHHWKYQEPDPSVDSPSWEGHKFPVTCVNCGAMDFKKAPRQS